MPDLCAEILGRDLHAIVAADRWKGRSLTAEPPEKWHRLRPETRKFWTDEARRILDRIEAETGGENG